MLDLPTLTRRLTELDNRSNERDWPEQSMRLLSDSGCMKKVIAEVFGGSPVTPEAQLLCYEAVAAGSLTLALILTQHDGACELLGQCDNRDLTRELLTRCASGKALATVGISQLTTSHRTKGPAMRAVAKSGGFSLTGVMPWVTSAAKADYIVTGAVLPDDLQILACVPTDANGLTVESPMDLMALGSSWTARVTCEEMFVPTEHLMRGPTERVLALRAAVKPLSVSAVGMGVAGRLLAMIRERAPSLVPAKSLLEGDIPDQYQAVRCTLFAAADALNDPSAETPAMDIRVSVNDLVVRLAVTVMTLSKGSGYLSTHVAQRVLREAMFFLVWSAPPHVQTGTLKALWNRQ